MEDRRQKIVIVGGGIAGLCAAVYALRCGYDAEVLEMHETAGGLATSWKRGGYTFETCLHWLLGSKPDGEWYSRWKEVFDIDKLTFVNPEEFVRVEDSDGRCLHVYSNVDRLKEEMLQVAPQDDAEIRYFTSAIRRLSKFKIPDPGEGLGGNWLTYLHDVPYMPLWKELSKESCEEFRGRFTNPLLRAFFGEGEMAQMSVLTLVLSLAWMNDGDAGYAIGGSQAIIRLIVEKLKSLGGRLRLGAKVERILVADDSAVGVELDNGEWIMADWVISAADGHATIFELLGGKYIDKAREKMFEEFLPFPSYLQVSLGVARDLSDQPGFVTMLLESPLHVDPGTKLNRVSFRIFHYDPTFAPEGKTAVTCFLPTRNYEYWVERQRDDPAGYETEKFRIAQDVIKVLEKRVPNLQQAVEVTDVSTPASVIRFTGNWKGSMEGWMPTPHIPLGPMPNMLHGLRNFVMAGHWVMPGGGLPSGLITGRAAMHTVCKHDHVPFLQPEEVGIASLYPY